MSEVSEVSLWSKLAMIGALPLLVAFGVAFHRAQARGALGGAISKAKAYWLPFAIWMWFVVSPAVGFDVVLRGVADEGAGRALLAFGLFMWLRGAVEMVMLYVTKNWVPPIGITHDVLCILVLLGMGGYGLTQLDFTTASELTWSIYALLAVMIATLIVEIHHAYAFFVAVQGLTKGEDGIWFADEHQERFRKINRNTFRWNVIFTLLVGAFVVRWVLA
jgi:hypothetical protein